MYIIHSYPHPHIQHPPPPNKLYTDVGSREESPTLLGAPEPAPPLTAGEGTPLLLRRYNMYIYR